MSDGNARAELRDVIAAALRDPTIFLIEQEDHAEDYWRRQAIRVEAAVSRLLSAAIVPVVADPTKETE